MVDLVAVFFTFLIARRLYDWRAGLFAALLLALAVMPIQQSHFFTMDNWATAFVTAGIYAAVRAATLGDAEPRWRLRWWALFGLALGLAAASRVNVAPLAVIIVVSAVTVSYTHLDVYKRQSATRCTTRSSCSTHSRSLTSGWARSRTMSC